MKGANLVLAVLAVPALLFGGCKSEDKSGDQEQEKKVHEPKVDPASARILVVLSKDFPLYHEAVDGFRNSFAGQVKQMVIPGPSVGGEDHGAFFERVRSEKPDAILAVGLRAAKLVTVEVPGVPVVFCMAMHPKQHGLMSSNSTGVDLEPWPKEQLSAFKEAIPGLKRVGIIYDHRRTGRFVDAARQAAGELGLTLVAKQVSERKEVLDALKGLTKDADALWLIRDATVLTREFFDHVVTVQKESKLPLLAYSPQFVKKGALCSYTTTYQQQGKTAAEVMQKILSGSAKPGDIPLQAPKGILTVNLASADLLDLKLPESILADPAVEKIDKTEKVKETDFPKEPTSRKLFSK